MTQVKEMTNSELNLALYKIVGHADNYYWALPDYCTDHSASLEVQAAAIAKDGIQYLHNLSDIVEPDEPNYKQEDETVAYTFEHTVKLLAASPRERSEAAYMVLS